VATGWGGLRTRELDDQRKWGRGGNKDFCGTARKYERNRARPWLGSLKAESSRDRFPGTGGAEIVL